ncbi:ABC transporter substrate-binding protein [Tindallia californiensis]|uniref:Peptide/nickel transport system substrate-binding protein n=1 Tax=Tindallia californiensis TaxID=159292 RepID=A0A1H3P8V8_9FIRM|nr:ABC transporter substrate-binding protein [Tindallia californiensis]SDY97363.1 peptide/nickel transport system substrate-binding protein [Tindallia californiensis]
MRMMKRKSSWLSLLLAAALLLSACGGGGTSEPATPVSDIPDEEMGDVVPSITIYSSLPEDNMVNYEMAQEVVEELQKLGVDATAQPMDFAVLLDVLYGDESDFDAYTIGWSGRIERLDPDMFIHSINHSANAEPGGNNTNRYRNPAFDELADAQRREMDLDARRELVWEAQKILAEDVPKITLYSRANMQTYNKELFEDVINIPGEGLFNEWTPFSIKPKTDKTVLTVASNVNIDDMNPLSSRSVYGWRNLRLIYDKLVRISPDIEPVPWAAESWDIVEDNIIDVVLREGMTFHDGEPVTVEDVKFSYELFINENVEYFASFTEPIESIEITDENTVRFILEEPYAPFITNTLAQIPILPKHIWENIDNPVQYGNEDAIGSGPFKLDRFQTGEELVLSKFDDYFEPVHIDGYIFQIFASPEGVLTALELGNVDMVSYDLVPAHTEQIANNADGQYDHLELTEADDIGFFYLGMNLDRAPFSNKDFRIAMAHLVDYDLALDVHLNGYGARGGAGLTIVEANEFWHNPEVPIYDTYDPEMAKEILIEAGFTWDSEGKLRMPAQ